MANQVKKVIEGVITLNLNGDSKTTKDFKVLVIDTEEQGVLCSLVEGERAYYHENEKLKGFIACLDWQEIGYTLKLTKQEVY